MNFPTVWSDHYSYRLARRRLDLKTKQQCIFDEGSDARLDNGISRPAPRLVVACARRLNLVNGIVEEDGLRCPNWSVPRASFESTSRPGQQLPISMSE